MLLFSQVVPYRFGIGMFYLTVSSCCCVSISLSALDKTKVAVA